MLLARGLLMLSPLLMLMPTTTDMDILPMDTDPMVPSPTTDLMDTMPLVRGLLMLSPLLMPMPTTDMDILPMDTDPMLPTPPTDTDMPDTGKPSLPTKDLPKFQESKTSATTS